MTGEKPVCKKLTNFCIGDEYLLLTNLLLTKILTDNRILIPPLPVYTYSFRCGDDILVYRLGTNVNPLDKMHALIS